MAARSLLFYLPLIPAGCMLCMIVGVGVWVHYTQTALNQIELALALLDYTPVTAANHARMVAAVKGTSSSYMVFACALFGLGLWRKLLAVQHDTAGPNPKLLLIYRAANATVHFLWWLLMAWVVLLMMGLAVMSILTWVGYRALNQAADAQEALAPAYASWLAARGGRAVDPTMLAVAGGELVAYSSLEAGWPLADACPAACVSLRQFQFLQVDAADAGCVCDKAVLRLVAAAARAALDAVPGLMVGIWFMYIFGDLLKTSLACDFTGASRDAQGVRPAGAPAGARGGAAAAGRGYNKL